MATDPGMLTDWYQSYMKTKPTTAQATTAQAGTTDWAPDKSATVQGQLTSVLDAGGPLMDRAATKANQVANGRGLLNSSIAVGAGQAALYDAALPIAQQDATVNAQAGQFNAGAKNAAALSNANALNQTSQFNATSQNAAEGQQRGAGITSEQTAQQRAEAEAGRAFTTSERQGAEQFQGGLQDKDIANQQGMQKAGFTQQSAIQATDIANQNAMQAKDLSSRYDLASMDVASRAALQKADAENQQKLQKANAELQTGLQATDSAVKQSMQQYQLSVQQAMAGQDNATKLQLATMDADTQSSLAELNNKYRVQLQASQSMAASYQSYVDAASRVMIDPNMDLAAKQYQLDNLARLYNNTLKMQSDVTGLNLGELLVDPTPTPPETPNASLPGNRGDDDTFDWRNAAENAINNGNNIDGYPGTYDNYPGSPNRGQWGG